MMDARWLEVDDDVHSAAKHFKNAVAIYEEGLSSEDDLTAYKGRMAFMQAMQAGYTSLEGAFERIFEILGEEKPTSGQDYHAQRVRRVGRDIPGDRSAIVAGDLLSAVDEARKFRHVARRTYDDFNVLRATPAVAAAKMISEAIQAAIAAFRAKIDSEPAKKSDGGD